MIRQEKMPFQLDRPVFVKRPFQSWGRQLKKGDEFKWKEIGVTEEKTLILYREGFIYHNSDFEIERKVGDGLEELDVDGLHGLVDSINDKVKSKTPSEAEFQKKKCKKSKIVDKQRGLIRSWRRNYGHMET
jgi:hypothetical protein